MRELVRFDPEAAEGERLRVWDRVREDLVERQLGADRTPCLVLGLNWTVCPDETEPVGLRLVNDAGELLEVPEEAEARHAAAAEAQAAEARAREAVAEARAAEARAREAVAETRARTAETRIRELEEQLRRAQGGGGSSGAS